eukprot:SAG31_NODE_36233_length_315_cov_0.902778_2_plen_77_part_01
MHTHIHFHGEATDSRLDLSVHIACIVRFKEDAGLAGWIKTVKDLFQKNSAGTVLRHGWRELFRIYDADGSGEVDVDE